MNKPFNFILIGRSGCGKGTQAELLIKKFGYLRIISTGDLLRNLGNLDTDAARRVKRVLETGGLIFDDLATALWMHEIAFNIKEDTGVLADGFPRRLIEAKNLDRFLEFLERKENTTAILIDISEEEALNRLTKRRICKSCGKTIPFLEPYKNWEKCMECGGESVIRMDDSLEAIKHRLNFFEESVVPVIEYYKSQNCLITVNGAQSIEKVFEEMLNFIAKLLVH
ncbi:MAG: nucleoside monophosphate kinase [bacterium]|nr:nucleoside monophosphate kinase [bacterium]